MGIRHSGREFALKALYRIDICGGASSDDLATLFSTFEANDEIRRFAGTLITGARNDQRQLDAIIAETLEHWSMGRLSRIDHNILRLAVWELLHLDDIPARVTIDEAIELAKAYGDRDSGRFVNGVLDRIAEKLELKAKGEDSAPVKVE